MPKSVINTIVFANRGEAPFSNALFDERELCDDFGPLDDDQVKINHTLQCQYAEGRYEFTIGPDRIFLRSNQDHEVLPPVLVNATHKVAGALEPMRKIIPVTAFGMNCDTAFFAKEVGIEGKDLCHSMAMNSFSRHLLQEQSFRLVGSVSFICSANQILYTLRVEPEHATQGADIFTAVNAHQDIKTEDSLQQKVNAAEEIRGQIEQFHRQVLTLKER